MTILGNAAGAETTSTMSHKTQRNAYLTALTPAEKEEFYLAERLRAARQVSTSYAVRAQDRAVLNELPADGYQHSAESKLANSLYLALSEARDASMLGTPMLHGPCDLSRPGFTASLVLAQLYSAAEQNLNLLKTYHFAGDQGRQQELQKLLDVLTPLVATIDVDAESKAYTDAMDRRYRMSAEEIEAGS